MFKFPARFEPAPDGGYVVTFRDIPEALPQGDTREEAEVMALDALVCAMDFYFEDRRAVPLPSKARRSEVLVELPPSVSAKVELLNRVIESQTRPADLARAMGIKPQEITRILDLHHATKIDTLAQAFSALGYELALSVNRKTVAI
jgi:antitoxin HicB